ncbi:MAG TPA: hypothetical protein VGR88_11355 [Ktedonobacterales bacterium]|nr:hypothetical protein [Ktedonobacterales bacterium]
MFSVPDIPQIFPEAGLSDEPDQLDMRLPRPPVWPAILGHYVTAHSAASEQLGAWHSEVSAISQSLGDARLWEGPDRDAQVKSWETLGAQHIMPAKGTMQAVHGALAAFQKDLTAVRQESRLRLRLADAHLQRAQAWLDLARARIVEANVQLGIAEAALASATAAAAATLGAASEAVVVAQMRLAEAVREVEAAQQWQMEAMQDEARARQEQQAAEDFARAGYTQADGSASAALGAIQAPIPTTGSMPTDNIAAAAGGAGTAAQGGPITGDTFATSPEWKPALPSYGIPPQGQALEQGCGTAGAQNALGAIGINPGQDRLNSLANLNADGSTEPDNVALMNAYMRENTDAVGRHFGYGSAQYQAALSGRDLVRFQPVTIDQLATSTDSGLPSLVPLHTPDGGWHNVDVYNVDRQNGLVHVWDSLPQPDGVGREVPIDQFMQQWGGHASVLAV